MRTVAVAMMAERLSVCHLQVMMPMLTYAEEESSVLKSSEAAELNLMKEQ